MDIVQNRWLAGKGWDREITKELAADIVFVFAAKDIIHDKALIREINTQFDGAQIVGCSTAGEICGAELTDNSCVVTAVKFKHTKVKVESVELSNHANSQQAGHALIDKLKENDLKHVVIISNGTSNGTMVNGDELVKGINEALPENVNVTGGLAGDGANFQQTLTFHNNNLPYDNSIIAIGFYGEKLRVGYGSMGGWDAFGPQRKVTKATGPVLYELDGESALEIYKKYLGDKATDLPASALLFPLCLKEDPNDKDTLPVVRTILAVDEAAQSMTFAGDIKEGHFAQFMKANFDHLVEGAEKAASHCLEILTDKSNQFGLLISCVGRKLVLKQRTEEELEAVRDILGNDTILTGFYSYGELSPFSAFKDCRLHNQTMTIATFSEVD